MKQIFKFALCSLLIVVLSFAIIGCEDSDTKSDDESHSTSKSEESSQEVKVQVLGKDTYLEEQEDMEMPDGSSIPMLDNQYVLLEIKITNLTDKDIESLSGTLNIKNGDYKVKLICNFDQEIIPADDYIIYEEYGFQLGMTGFDMDEKVIYDCDYEDLDFEFVVDEIVYQ